MTCIIVKSVGLVIEKRKREFVHYSKRFSNTLKEYFRDQNATQVRNPSRCSPEITVCLAGDFIDTQASTLRFLNAH